MDVITAVVIGGTSIFGGLGRLGGSLLGVLIIGMITNGMLLLDIHSYWQQVAKGLILIIAVGAETHQAEERGLRQPSWRFVLEAREVSKRYRPGAGPRQHQPAAGRAGDPGPGR